MSKRFLSVLVFALVAAFVGFLLSRTTYGPKLYMLGTSERAARFSGLKNDRLLMKTYILSGICASLGGLIMLANYNSARADYGTVYTLQCVLIVVLGGVSPSGGKGKLSGVLLAKNAPNRANAIKLIEWLAGEKAQQIYADANYEYPVRAGVAVNSTIAGYGTLKPDTLPIAKIAASRKAASTLVDKVGFDN